MKRPDPSPDAVEQAAAFGPVRTLLWGLVLAVMLLLASSLALFMVPMESYAQPLPGHADHIHGHHAEQAPAEAAGGPWQADRALTEGIARLERAVDKAREQGNASDAVALSRTLESEVVLLIENCRLPPQADQALHGLLAELLDHAERLRSEGEVDRVLPALDKTLRDYRRLFIAPEEGPEHAH